MRASDISGTKMETVKVLRRAVFDHSLLTDSLLTRQHIATDLIKNKLLIKG